jgi:hypothetical protein
MIYSFPSEHNGGAFTVEVFGVDGNCRALGRVRSISDAMEFLDTIPACLVPEEKLLIRIEGPDFGSWIYFGPPDQPSDWPMSEAAQRVRARIERRKRGA